MMMNNGDTPASAIRIAASKNAQTQAKSLGGFKEDTYHTGLTKREAFAMAAMQGLMVNIGRNGLELKDLDRVKVRAYEMANLMVEGQQSSTDK